MSREGRVRLPLIREQGRGFGFGGRSFKPPAGDYLPAWRSAYRTITGRCVAHQERIFPILTPHTRLTLLWSRTFLPVPPSLHACT